MTAAGNEDWADDHLWARLAARVLHPVQVQAIEAMRWIDRPLSAADLAEVVSPTLPWRYLAHHLRRLTRIGAIELAERPTQRNVAAIRFRLVVERKP